MNTVVFLGPSLDSRDAAQRLDAHYAKPARRGDIAKAVDAGAQGIALIDGEFGQSLAVSVMEIRSALERGVQVWGAASMGALRAAECASLGMRGVGWVFSQYASGVLTADDEVALLFDPHSHRARTIPLVNFRWTVTLLREEGLFDEGLASDVVGLAAGVHFAERSAAELSCVARGTHAAASMNTTLYYMEENPQRCDRKRLDALMLLQTLASSPSPKRKPGDWGLCVPPNLPASTASACHAGR